MSDKFLDTKFDGDVLLAIAGAMGIVGVAAGLVEGVKHVHGKLNHEADAPAVVVTEQEGLKGEFEQAMDAEIERLNTQDTPAIEVSAPAPGF